MEKVMQNESGKGINGFYDHPSNETFVSTKDLRAFCVEVLLQNAGNDPTKIACAKDFISMLDTCEEWIISSAGSYE